MRPTEDHLTRLVKLSRLWNLCSNFIQNNQIRCTETVYQCDHVSENALDFIEKVAEMVGYYKDKEAE